MIINWSGALQITIHHHSSWILVSSVTATAGVLQLALLLEFHVGHAARTYLARVAVPDQHGSAWLSMAQPPWRYLVIL